MPLDIPAAPAEAMASEPLFFEPRLPATDSDDWHATLRQIFATESGIWHRRTIEPRPALRGG